MSVRIKVKDQFGSFLSNGEEGVRFRYNKIEPKIDQGKLVILDFEGVENMTDSFANACFGSLFRRVNLKTEGKIKFVNCNPVVKSFLISAMSFAKRRVKADQVVQTTTA